MHKLFHFCVNKGAATGSNPHWLNRGVTFKHIEKICVEVIKHFTHVVNKDSIMP